MKKVLAVFAVLTMVGLSSIAFAADVTVGGSVQIRSRDFNTLNLNKDDPRGPGNTVDTQERIMIDVNAKVSDDLKGKITIWNDFEDWGRLESSQGNGFGSTTGTGVSSNGTDTTSGHFGFREAWLSFNIPGVPVNVTAGHQLLALGNEWFLRNKHFGSDAWVIANVTGNNTAAFVDIKVAEGNAGRSDDVDAYALLDVFKFNDNNMAGINLTNVRFGTSDNALQNIELHYAGKIAIVNLKAQADFQMGTDKAVVNGTGSDQKYKGNQIIVSGNVPIDPVTINFLLGRGSGPKIGQTDINQYINFLDIDPHYTFLYEYKIAGACGLRNQGFCNTTAYSVGAAFAATKSLTVGADFYFLTATEKMANKKSGIAGETTNDLGTEVDLIVNWKLYDNLTWNWTLGYLKPGDALGSDAATGVQGILAFKF
jgi:hypothetical protein